MREKQACKDRLRRHLEHGGFPVPAADWGVRRAETLPGGGRFRQAEELSKVRAVQLFAATFAYYV